MRLAGHVARIGEMRDVYRVLGGKRALGVTSLSWKYNIKVDLTKSGMRSPGLELSNSGQEQVAGSCEFGNEPSGFIKCGEFLD
jgi:hypothetical protein